VVGNDDDVATAQVLVVLDTPLARARSVGRRHEAEGSEALDVLLAFDDKDGCARVCREEFGEAVKDAANALEVVKPSAPSVGTALAESLRLVAKDLVEERALLVEVVVSCNQLT